MPVLISEIRDGQREGKKYHKNNTIDIKLILNKMGHINNPYLVLVLTCNIVIIPRNCNTSVHSIVYIFSLFCSQSKQWKSYKQQFVMTHIVCPFKCKDKLKSNSHFQCLEAVRESRAHRNISLEWERRGRASVKEIPFARRITRTL